MSWFTRHSAALEAGATLVTALVAVVALLGVKWQLDEADRLSALQSAREAYRGHLVLAVGAPDFAAPADGCAVLASAKGGAYRAFVDHLLYAAEQMLSVEAGWEPTFLAEIAGHQDYFCSVEGPAGDSDAVAAVIAQFRSSGCPAKPACQ